MIRIDFQLFDLYIGENSLAIWATLPVVLFYLVTAIIVFRSYLRTRNNISLYFLFFNLTAMMAWGAWFMRAAFYSSTSRSLAIEFWWRLGYFFGALSLFGISFIALKLIHSDRFTRKYIFLYVFVIIITIVLIIIADIEETIYCDVTDYHPTFFYQVIFGCIILANALIPNYIFILYLRKGTKGTNPYRRVLFLEIGLALYSIGMLAEGTKLLVDNFSMFVFRGLVAIGGLIMLLGLRLPKFLRVPE